MCDQQSIVDPVWRLGNDLNRNRARGVTKTGLAAQRESYNNNERRRILAPQRFGCGRRASLEAWLAISLDSRPRESN